MTDDRPVTAMYLFSTADVIAFVEDVRAGRCDDLDAYFGRCVVAGAMSIEDEAGAPVAVMVAHPTWLRRRSSTAAH